MKKTFIEIGSSYFDTLNHLADYGWKGIIIEPISKYLDMIERKDSVSYINCAVSHTPGEITMYTFIDEIVEQDSDFAGMSTIDPSKLNKKMFTQDKYKKWLKEVKVPALTYKIILDIQNIDRVDYLKIDTEGHDFEILKTVDFETSRRPKNIKIEHKHVNKNDLTNFLKEKGYHVDVQKDDVFAIDLK